MKKVYSGVIPSMDLLPYVRLVVYGSAYIDTYKFNVIDVKEEVIVSKNYRTFSLTIECEDIITDEEVKGKQA